MYILKALKYLRGLFSIGSNNELSRKRKKQKLYAILKRVDSLPPSLDHRSNDEILGFDENGIST
jgi:hypothetical protein